MELYTSQGSHVWNTDRATRNLPHTFASASWVSLARNPDPADTFDKFLQIWYLRNESTYDSEHLFGTDYHVFNHSLIRSSERSCDRFDDGRRVGLAVHHRYILPASERKPVAVLRTSRFVARRCLSLIYDFQGLVTALLSYPYTHPIQVGWCSRNAGAVASRTVNASLYNM